MRATGRCRGCAVALAATYMSGAWTWELKDRVESWKSKIPNYDSLPEFPTSWARRGGQKVVEIQEILGIPVTSQLAVTVAYPKITDAPLIRRKLGSNKWDLIHEGIQGQKRDATSCPADYQLCPKSMNGGCCPNDRVCGESSCLPASATVASACGKSGYAACGIEDGGGCCPTGYVCGRAGCSPSAGVTYSETCGIDSFLCPASLNYGCCKSGMACGINNCYATTVTTFTLTETFTTTDSNSNAQTLTTTVVSAATPTAPTPTATTDSGVIPKLNAPPSAIPKTEASGTQASGLTGGQIGGIIAGAVAILIAVLVAAFVIMRRLNKAIKVSDANSRTRTSSSGPRSGHSRPRPRAGPRTVDVDAMSVDPLMMTPSEVSETIQIPAYISTTPGAAHEVDSSPVFRSPFSPRSPPFTTYQQGYNPVASSESQYSSSSAGGYRNGSVESTPPMSQIPAGGYFDIPAHPDHNSPTSYISPASQTRRSSQHGRNWSNASDQSAVSQTSSNMVELDAGLDGDRRSSLSRALQGMGLGRMVSRRRSEPLNHPHSHHPNQQPTVLTGGPSRPDWSPPASMGGFGNGNGGGAGRGVLGHIPEAGESRLGLDAEGDVNVGLSNAQLRQLSISGRKEDNAYTRREEYG